MPLLQVKTKYGVVKGKEEENGNAAFRGIPYAKPPIGSRRFKAPEEPDCWEEELLCDRNQASCIQTCLPGRKNYHTSEDCLYLNVFTPAGSTDKDTDKNNDKKLPVMCWFFGGGFKEGGIEDPEFNGGPLTKENVIVVTVNYRCGVLGFFYHENLEKQNGYSGNLGLLDQIQGLKWIRDNIEAFGGDPDNVTIFGQSAGGISCRMHLTSPVSRGLFHKAIIHSGGGFNEADPVREKAEFADICKKAMEKCGYSLEDLMTADANELNEKMTQAGMEIINHQEIAVYQPFKDGYVLPEVPGIAVSEGNYADLPIICCTVPGDSWMFSRKILPEIKKTGNVNYYRAFSLSPSQVWGRAHANDHRKNPFYTCYFDRTQPEISSARFTRAHFGKNCVHGSDVAYVFGTLSVRGIYDSPKDYEISRTMMKYWTNFARTGNPNTAGLTEWRPYTQEEPCTLHVTDSGILYENIINSPDEETIYTLIQTHPGLTTSWPN